MFTFLSDAMLLTMRCLPILNNAMFRHGFKQNIPYDVLLTMHISDVFMTIFGNISRSTMEPTSRVESARAVTGRRCPHSGEGEDFLRRQPGFLGKQL